MSEIFEQKYSNESVIKYVRLKSGTCYHAETPKKIIKVLEEMLNTGTEVRVFYGDTKTGQSWQEENDVIGCIGRSTGNIKIPLLVPVGEPGGPGLLDHCIIRIDTREGTLYQHKKFRIGEMTLTKGETTALPWEVFIDNVLHARFERNPQAVKFMDFLQGNLFAM